MEKETLSHQPGQALQTHTLRPDIPKIEKNLLTKVSCAPCCTAKTRRAQINPSTSATYRLLELVHLDISGKVEQSYAGFLHSVVFLDDFTKKSDITLLKNKSDLFNALVAYKMRSEVEFQEFGFQLTNIRMNRAPENTINDVKQFCITKCTSSYRIHA